ncbi:hypothetical protein DEO72_LG7g1578 [Vigna unguiculata]|uniref:Uncharacterized protein n=1 Tax=Vigna unguiculata TaxID=3917 RepID=A0A4D6MGZ8_VIGUN|nr:hypothetical protein DEO72_LG7g1578 [Vigna unguiculata]
MVEGDVEHGVDCCGGSVMIWRRWWREDEGSHYRCNNGAKRKEEVAVVMAARRSDATFVHGGEKIEVCCFCLLWSHMVEGDVEHGVDCCGGSVMIWRRWWREDEGSHYRLSVGAICGGYEADGKWRQHDDGG